jgi:hypothetical protein
MADYQDFINWERQQGIIGPGDGYRDNWNQAQNPWGSGGGTFWGLAMLVVLCVLLPIAFVGVFTGFQWPQKRK